METFDGLAQTYPLMRGGAVLFIIGGLGIVIGSIGGRRCMLPSLIIGDSTMPYIIKETYANNK